MKIKKYSIATIYKNTFISIPLPFLYPFGIKTVR